MIRFKQFLLEADASPSQYYGTKLGSINTGSFFPTISGQGGGSGVIVSNPTGESSTRSSFGMGFELAPQLTGTVQQFINQYGDKTDNSAVSKAYSEKIKAKFNLPAQDKVVTWQTMNVAVSNQQAEELNKLLVKYNLKSDTPPRSPDQIEYEEYQRWLDTQIQEWEKANPAPVRTDDMSEEEWESLWQAWLFEREIYKDGREQWYMHNTGPYARPPFPDPKPKPKPKTPTWSPRPDWVPEPFEPNPNWWHMGPDQSDDGFAGMNSPNGQSPNFLQDPKVPPPAPAAPDSPGSNPNGINLPPNPSPGDTYTTPSGTTFVFADGRWRLVSTSAPPKPDQKPSKPKPPNEKPKPKPKPKPAPRPRQPGVGETTDPGYVPIPNRPGQGEPTDPGYIPRLRSQGGPQNKPGSNPGMGLSPQEKLTDKINNIKGTNSDNGQSPQKALLNKNNVRQDPNVFGPPAPVENPNSLPNTTPEPHRTPGEDFDRWWQLGDMQWDIWQEQWRQTHGKGLDDLMKQEFDRMYENLRMQYERLMQRHLQRGGQPGHNYKFIHDLIRQFYDYFTNPPPIYA